MRRTSSGLAVHPPSRSDVAKNGRVAAIESFGEDGARKNDPAKHAFGMFGAQAQRACRWRGFRKTTPLSDCARLATGAAAQGVNPVEQQLQVGLCLLVIHRFLLWQQKPTGSQIPPAELRPGLPPVTRRLRWQRRQMRGMCRERAIRAAHRGVFIGIRSGVSIGMTRRDRS